MAEPSPSATIWAFLGCGVLALVVTLISIALSLAGKLSMGGAKLCLLAAWIICVFGIYSFTPVLRSPAAVRILFTISLGAALGIGFHYLSEWMSRKESTFVTTPAEQSESNPGLSLHMLIRVSHLPADRRKYLFDFGKTDAERLSIYVSSDNILTLCFTDAKHEPHLIQVPIGGRGIPIGSFQYLACDLGVSGQSTYLGMRLNGEEIRILNLPFKTDIGALDVPNGVMGADLSGDNGAAFDLAELAVYSRTIVGSESRKLSEYFTNQSTDKYVEFSGKQWMRVSDGPTRDAKQEDLSKAPKYRVRK